MQCCQEEVRDNDSDDVSANVAAAVAAATAAATVEATQGAANCSNGAAAEARPQPPSNDLAWEPGAEDDDDEHVDGGGGREVAPGHARSKSPKEDTADLEPGEDEVAYGSTLGPGMTMYWKSQDPDYEMEWSRGRKFCAYILNATFKGSDSNIFDSVMGLVIFTNIVLMIMETDASASCEKEDNCVPKWLDVCNYILLGIYTVEVLMRIFVLRCRFLVYGWNLLDLCIVLIGLLGLCLSSESGEEASKINILRMFRIARVVRVAKILKRFPTLSNMIAGFTGAMQAMFWGLILILILLVGWSLLAVELIHPINAKLQEKDEYCAEAFTTVLRATLIFFQTLVAGDSWGNCALAIIKEQPFTFVIFSLALVTVQLGFTNLVLAIIVDKASEARELSKDDQIKQKMSDQNDKLDMCRELMHSLDADASGCLTMEELMEGYRDPEIRDTLDELTIGKDDLKRLFQLMDREQSGHIGYDEFVDNLYKAQTMDMRMYLLNMKLLLEKMHYQFSLTMDQKFRELSDGIRLTTGSTQAEAAFENEAPRSVADTFTAGSSIVAQESHREASLAKGRHVRRSRHDEREDQIGFLVAGLGPLEDKLESLHRSVDARINAFEIEAEHTLRSLTGHHSRPDLHDADSGFEQHQQRMFSRTAEPKVAAAGPGQQVEAPWRNEQQQQQLLGRRSKWAAQAVGTFGGAGAEGGTTAAIPVSNLGSGDLTANTTSGGTTGSINEG
mmetsp:Transcript_70937/g.178884  ORF Transcript_70937/g.178884 Transcript_70937/m.178884 type:complete len:729 (-) Transcript_70937:50-2236(-)